MKTTVKHKEVKKNNSAYDMWLGKNEFGQVCLVTRYVVVALTEPVSSSSFHKKGSSWSSQSHASAETYANILNIVKDDKLIVTLENDDDAD